MLTSVPCSKTTFLPFDWMLLKLIVVVDEATFRVIPIPLLVMVLLRTIPVQFEIVIPMVLLEMMFLSIVTSP